MKQFILIISLIILGISAKSQAHITYSADTTVFLTRSSNSIPKQEITINIKGMDAPLTKLMGIIMLATICAMLIFIYYDLKNGQLNLEKKIKKDPPYLDSSIAMAKNAIEFLKKENNRLGLENNQLCSQIDKLKKQTHEPS